MKRTKACPNCQKCVTTRYATWWHNPKRGDPDVRVLRLNERHYLPHFQLGSLSWTRFLTQSTRFVPWRSAKNVNREWEPFVSTRDLLSIKQTVEARFAKPYAHRFNLWKILLTLNVLSTVQWNKLLFYHLSYTGLQVLWFTRATSTYPMSWFRYRSATTNPTPSSRPSASHRSSWLCWLLHWGSYKTGQTKTG